MMTKIAIALTCVLSACMWAVTQINQHLQNELYGLRKPKAGALIKGVSPQNYVKNSHVLVKTEETPTEYKPSLDFKDHKNMKKSWAGVFSKTQADADVAKYGMPASIYQPYTVTAEIVAKRDKTIADGMWKKQGKYLVPDISKIANFYKPYTKPVADYINVLAAGDVSWNTRLMLSMRFCQDIPYGIPPDNIDGKETGEFLTPPQVLINMYGDCDSKCGLFASIMSHFNQYGMIFVHVPNHLLMGVEGVPGPYDTYFSFQNKKYVAVEPVGPGRLNPGRYEDEYSRIELIEVFTPASALGNDKPADKAIVPVAAPAASLGTVYFWTRSANIAAEDTKITFAANEIGEIGYYFPMKPQCAQTGTVVSKIAPGVYDYLIENAQARWAGQITVKGGDCQGIEIKE